LINEFIRCGARDRRRDVGLRRGNIDDASVRETKPYSALPAHYDITGDGT